MNEAKNRQDEMFDLETPGSSGAPRTDSVEELKAAILGAVEEFTRGTYLIDLTLLIIRYQGQVSFKW